jgi:hypothetical protein
VPSEQIEVPVAWSNFLVPVDVVVRVGTTPYEDMHDLPNAVNALSRWVELNISDVRVTVDTNRACVHIVTRASQRLRTLVTELEQPYVHQWHDPQPAAHEDGIIAVLGELAKELKFISDTSLNPVTHRGHGSFVVVTADNEYENADEMVADLNAESRSNKATHANDRWTGTATTKDDFTEVTIDGEMDALALLEFSYLESKWSVSLDDLYVAFRLLY